VTRNANFWSAFYEVQPGDPGFALLHAALLLSGGEAQRAAAFAAFGLQRPAIPEEIKRGLTALIAYCNSAQARSTELVQMGIRFYDMADFPAALRKFDAAIADWPANGGAYYERGSTLRMKAIAEARLGARELHGAEAPAPPPDPPETAECFARARRHDPLQLLAYQGEDPTMRTALMALVRSGLPVWEAIRKHPDQLVKVAHLRDFSDACRVAAIDDFALVLRQLVVASNKHYAAEDSELIAESLGRLAPASLTPALRVRIGGETKMPTRQIVVPMVVAPPEIAQANGDDPSANDAKKRESAEKPKAKSGRSGKPEGSSGKAKRKAADKDSLDKPKTSKAKKRKS
jgi:hypothetical protein